MRWPWKRGASSRDRLIVSWSAQTFAFVRARQKSDGVFKIMQMGVERQGNDSMEAFVQRLSGLGLKGGAASIMLRPEQYQVLQIDAPPVPPEELRSAARFQIRDMVDVHMDDITLDVMRVGDEAHRTNNHLFVVVATNATVRDVLDLADALRWDVAVIDIQEMAVRNLQTALARRDARLERADAALILADERQAMLTVSANEELFYTRRMDLPPSFMDMAWSQPENSTASDAFVPVSEYVPDYSGGGSSYGSDYGSNYGAARGASGTVGAGGDMEKAQRLVVEVQRSLDLWDRSWSRLPLAGLRVFAGQRSAELAQWLERETGTTVTPLEVEAFFPDLPELPGADNAYCMPLLGALLRTETRKL